MGPDGVSVYNIFDLTRESEQWRTVLILRGALEIMISRRIRIHSDRNNSHGIEITLRNDCRDFINAAVEELEVHFGLRLYVCVCICGRVHMLVGGVVGEDLHSTGC
jgi:hypothetical protein